MNLLQLKNGKTVAGHKGIVLVFVAGILAILAALGMAFFTLTQSSTTSATRYSDMVRADFMAQAGIQYAIAQLRKQAYLKTEDANDPWFAVNYLDGASERISYPDDLGGGNKAPYSQALSSTLETNSDRFTLRIADAASKININAGDNLGVILDNLCRVIGPPLVAANPDALQPRRWAVEGATAGLFDNTQNTEDTATQLDLYSRLVDGRPIREAGGKVALYGDGYAIAAYRARNGRFNSIVEVRNALTHVERNGTYQVDDPLEQMEIEAKFAALRDYITIHSWVDTTTVGVGKFEWVGTKRLSELTDQGDVCHQRSRNVYEMRAAGTDQGVPVYDFQGLPNGLSPDNDYQILIDRDKSWIADDPSHDPLNTRGSLRGAYISIMNGHGAGQLRRIATNGMDWIAIHASNPDESMRVKPGPISSYMIIAREDALAEQVVSQEFDSLSPVTFNTYLPRVRANGALLDDPSVDYEKNPLCIHRAPVNVNTASEKVLAALFMGVNVQHGHPMAVGTDTDLTTAKNIWFEEDPRGYEGVMPTWAGLKRVPVSSGKLKFDRPMPTVDAKFAYLNNHGMLDPAGTSNVNEAQELAYRIITARQKIDPAVPSEVDPLTNYEKGPIRSWDDLYFRIVKPWDDARGANTASVARMLMAQCNPNTDILKFNPNIEWIDRWGRNFTQMEPVMVFDTTLATPKPKWITPPNNLDAMWSPREVQVGGKAKGAYYSRSLRYKSTDMIDKTDLNRSTTELSFDSNGIFEIQSVGEVLLSGLLNNVVSQRRIDVLVKVYDVWRETTQSQFVRGRFHAPGGMGKHGSINSGQISRDAYNTGDRMPLNTLPEPLVPRTYRLDSARLTELVDDAASYGRDVFGTPKDPGVPDVVANRILPARYDGQIVLATNTSSGPIQGGGTLGGESFLAHFDGDLDTDDCSGNGREQAKVPNNRRIRVVDVTGLLGVLNDRQVDFDPKESDSGAAIALAGNLYDNFATKMSAANGVFDRLNEANYWENVTCRMGDLRPDGVYLGSVGISGKDATLKYKWSGNINWNPSGAASKWWRVYSTVSVWFKPTWHTQDNIEHEFFNATNPGNGAGAREARLMKAGRWTYCGNNSAAYTRQYNNCLNTNAEDGGDNDFRSYLHGGTHWVPFNTNMIESPSYRSQPFRWGFVGSTINYLVKPLTPSSKVQGMEEDGFWGNTGGEFDIARDDAINNLRCPFINTQRDPHGPVGNDTFNTQYYYIANSKGATDADGNWVPKTQCYISDIGKQAIAWSWCDGADTTGNFGLNNINQSQTSWLYRATPVEGTQAVIDEFKMTTLCNVPGFVGYTHEQLYKETTTSRYYLPPGLNTNLGPNDPANRAICPTFTSQTLLQSRNGPEMTLSSETVAVVRVSWSGFTPRFMHENKQITNASPARVEVVSLAPKSIPFKGPFDYIQYNRELMLNALKPGQTSEATLNAAIPFMGVTRPTPKDYPADASGVRQAHASRAFEVELVDKDPGVDPTAPALAGVTFTNPDVPNTYIDTAAYNNGAGPVVSLIPRVKIDELRYRVRFLYPRDELVGGGKTVDPNTQYLLDTPVLDDVSVTYLGRIQYLDYQQVNE